MQMNPLFLLGDTFGHRGGIPVRVPTLQPIKTSSEKKPAPLFRQHPRWSSFKKGEHPTDTESFHENDLGNKDIPWNHVRF